MKTLHITRWFHLSILACCPVWLALAQEDVNSNGTSPRPLRVEGIENVYRLGDRVISGGQPKGEEAFRQLRELGVKTIISVDGAKPDLELAHKHGLRYVHLPIGYDGISRAGQLQLIKAGAVSEGPIFVHCHHGKHRGPTAAAIICMGNENLKAAWGNLWLRQAGTATNYAGLYQVVEEFEPPTAAALASIPSEFPEQVTVSDLVDAMVNIDIRWEHLQSIQAAGYRAPADHPDLDPANEALLLLESFKELERSEEVRRPDPGLLRLVREATKKAEALHAQISSTPRDLPTLDHAMSALKQSCKSCHEEYRD